MLRTLPVFLVSILTIKFEKKKNSVLLGVALFARTDGLIDVARLIYGFRIFIKNAPIRLHVGPLGTK